MPAELPARLHETRVNESVLVFSTGGETLATSYGDNAVAVLGDGSTLLVDPLVAPAVAAERMAVEHPDLLAERRASADVGALFADAVPAAASLRITGPLELSVGGVTAIVRPCGPAHTAGDLRVDLPALGVVVTGDLVSHGYHPNLEHADVRGWKRGLADLLREPAGTTFVPGHGAPGGREIVEAQVAWFDGAAEAVRSACAEGLGSAEAEERLRRRFPGYLLEIVVPTAVNVLLVPFGR